MTTSSSGQYVAGIDKNNVYLSSDYGISYQVSFASGLLNVYVYGIAMDATGQYQAVSTWSGGVLLSSSYGTIESWVPSYAPLVEGVNDTAILYGQIKSNNKGSVLTVVTNANQGVYSTYPFESVPVDPSSKDDDDEDDIFTSTPFIAGVAGGGGALVLLTAGYFYYAKAACFAKPDPLKQSLV
jgi:hypothetical protein